MVFGLMTKNKRIPVTVITGFLGSGKTTLLNHILSSKEHGLKFAIIENELGAIGIDDDLLQGTKPELVEEEIIEVMNGCICCTVRGDLVETLNKLYKKSSKFDNLIIETTGMADPAPVVQTFFVDHMLRKKYNIDCVITVVDAYHILERLKEKPSDREGENGGTINESIEQIAFADKVLLNKTDLLEGKHNGEEQLQQIESEIHKINPTATILRTRYGKVNPNELINLRSFDLDRVLSYEPELLDDIYETKHDANIGSIALSFKEELHHALFQNWLDVLVGGGLNEEDDDDQGNGKGGHNGHSHKGHDHHSHDHEPPANGDTNHGDDEKVVIEEVDEQEKKDWNNANQKKNAAAGTTTATTVVAVAGNPNDMKLFRYKGIFAIKGVPNKFLLQGVGMLYEGSFVNVCWKDDEVRESKMVFIGKNLKTDLLREGFESCKVTQELRYQVGEQVYVNIGEYTKGIILKQWDEGNAYRVRIANSKREVWAPLDIDEYIRKSKVFTTMEMER